MHTRTSSYNQKTMILVTYESSSLKLSDKVRFYYALKGRDGISGIVKLYSIEVLAKGVLLVPEEHKEDIKLFFSNWKLSHRLVEARLGEVEEVSKNE